jgi:FKBP-type peptidyl-prolyl cis-trans isomerase FklB
MKKILILVCLASLASGLQAAELSVSERYSYAMGVRLGELLQSQGISDLDSDAFAAAIDDVLNNRPLRLSDQEMRDAVIAQREAFAAQRAQRAQENLEAGRAFLARNASRPGVTVLPSGLQFEVLAQGNGAQPAETDTVRVHYHGSLIDGTVFDSSVERGTPAEFRLAGVVPGFREAISNMRVGDKWRVYLPSELGYGERGAGADISPNSALIFEIELLDIVR